ncbi:MAG: type II toxin-antitoxin system VapB family antitoxin [Mycobacterium sp.]|nr:type II toxin-antitoxin system VapB family antitoxin [Mycobacterium sp.]
MSLNIKNEDVHAAVRELAHKLGVSQTSAVALAVRAKLDEVDNRDARARRSHNLRAAAAAAQQAFRGVDLLAAEDVLYDESGLPR